MFATGTVGSAVAGLGQPLLFLVLGKISTLLSTHERYQSCGFQYSICFKDNLTRLNERFVQLNFCLKSVRENELMYSKMATTTQNDSNEQKRKFSVVNAFYLFLSKTSFFKFYFYINKGLKVHM